MPVRVRVCVCVCVCALPFSTGRTVAGKAVTSRIDIILHTTGLLLVRRVKLVRIDLLRSQTSGAPVHPPHVLTSSPPEASSGRRIASAVSPVQTGDGGLGRRDGSYIDAYCGDRCSLFNEGGGLNASGFLFESFV